MFEAFTRPGRFFRGNLHTHSTRSDGKLPPAEVCRRYAAMGYDFICLSDHFLPEYDFPIVDTTGERNDRFTTLFGAEVHAGEVKAGGPWHLLAVGLPLDFEPTPADEDGPALARRCRDAGAFVAIAHPQWYGLMADEARLIDAAHAVEIYNHSCAVQAARPDGTYLLDALLNEGNRLTAIASDDAHFLAENDENRDAFGGWIMVKAERNTPELLLEALKSGAFYATQGPELHEITRDGDHLVVRCSAASAIIVSGSGWRANVSNGASQTEARLALGSFAGAWVRVTVMDSAGNCAWSNPLQVD